MITLIPSVNHLYWLDMEDDAIVGDAELRDCIDQGKTTSSQVIRKTINIETSELDLLLITTKSFT